MGKNHTNLVIQKPILIWNKNCWTIFYKMKNLECSWEKKFVHTNWSIKYCDYINLLLFSNINVSSMRSNHRGYSVKKGLLKTFANFTEKHLCWSLSFNKFACLRLIEKETPTQVLSCEFCKIFKNTFSTQYLMLLWHGDG